MKRTLVILLVCVFVLGLTAGCSENAHEKPMCSGEVVAYNGGYEPVFFIVDSAGEQTAFVWTEDTALVWEDDSLLNGPADNGLSHFGGNLYVDVVYDTEHAEPPEEYSGIGDDDITGWYNALSVTVIGVDEEDLVDEKPVIYLYPTAETEVTVKLDFRGKLTTTYPAYNSGWTVLAQPDGTLANLADGKEYSYLFWEGIADVQYDLSSGFIVAGDDTAEFLQKTLADMGLTPEEYNEFIVYWLPQMEGNAYNLISFQTDAYTDNAVLNITPEPDSVLRVFMAWRGIEEPVDVEPQELTFFERTGFTVVEWGGAEVR